MCTDVSNKVDTNFLFPFFLGGGEYLFPLPVNMNVDNNHLHEVYEESSGRI